ncbi:MAG TPA: hypothetical protein VFC07_06410 [Verrucomicrobiae bacterium]|nr:hypothetical protein [Verrucomicrobiae bacterium]
MNKTTKTAALPILLNRLQLAEEIGVPCGAVYRACERGALPADALDAARRPLFQATPARLLALKQSLECPEGVA